MDPFGFALRAGCSALGVFCLFWADAFVYFKHQEAGLGPQVREADDEVAEIKQISKIAPHYFSTTIVPVIFG